MPAPPGSAVDEDEDWCGLATAAVDVEPLDLGRSIGGALGLADMPARQFAVADAALDQLLAVGRISGLVIGRVEGGLVVVEEYRQTFFGHRIRYRFLIVTPARAFVSFRGAGAACEPGTHAHGLVDLWMGRCS